MKIVQNDLEGKYAVPTFHPITCANPAPWLITEVKVVNNYDMEMRTCIWKILIRNENSMWFRADQCFINTRYECEEFIRIKGIQ